MILLFVGISGFEPELEEPKSSVLPLHHTPIKPPTFAGERKEKNYRKNRFYKIKNLCPKNLEIHSTKNIKKYHPPHPHGLSDGATKNLNLLYIKQSIMCQFEKPPTFTGKRENKNLKIA